MVKNLAIIERPVSLIINLIRWEWKNLQWMSRLLQKCVKICIWYIVPDVGWLIFHENFERKKAKQWGMLSLSVYRAVLYVLIQIVFSLGRLVGWSYSVCKGRLEYGTMVLTESRFAVNFTLLLVVGMSHTELASQSVVHRNYSLKMLLSDVQNCSLMHFLKDWLSYARISDSINAFHGCWSFWSTKLTSQHGCTAAQI